MTFQDLLEDFLNSAEELAAGMHEAKNYEVQDALTKIAPIFDNFQKLASDKKHKQHKEDMMLLYGHDKCPECSSDVVEDIGSAPTSMNGEHAGETEDKNLYCVSSICIHNTTPIAS